MAADTFRSALESKEIPINATAKEMAFTLFAIHLANNGIAGAYSDIYLNDALVTKLLEGNRASEMPLIRQALSRIQLNYLKILY